MNYWAMLKWSLEYKKQHPKAGKAELDEALKSWRIKEIDKECQVDRSAE